MVNIPYSAFVFIGSMSAEGVKPGIHSSTDGEFVFELCNNDASEFGDGSAYFVWVNLKRKRVYVRVRALSEQPSVKAYWMLWAAAAYRYMVERKLNKDSREQLFSEIDACALKHTVLFLKPNDEELFEIGQSFLSVMRMNETDFNAGRGIALIELIRAAKKGA